VIAEIGQNHQGSSRASSYESAKDSRHERGVAGGPERSFAAVTTFNETGYERYARAMIDTFLRHWPAEVTLYCSWSRSNSTR
jgi:hypothetical protein